MQRTEAERQFYLSMAGIRMWYAREGLPGAAPSPEYLFPEEGGDKSSPATVAPETPPAEPAPSRSGPPPAMSGLKAMVSGEQEGRKTASRAEGTQTEPAGKRQGDPEQQTAVPVGPLAVASPVPPTPVPERLDLGIWAGRHFVLISGVTEEASARLQDTLATNILRALGDGLESRAEFRWPVFANGQAVNDEASLTDCLSRLGKQYSGLRSVVLGFGEQAGGEAGVQAIRRAFAESGPGFPYTLAGLATSPERKRELWELLKPLADRS